MMTRCRRFEEASERLRQAGEVLGNTFPSLGQEAIGSLSFVLDEGDVLYPSYRSRPVFFGRGVTVLEHFRELFGSPRSLWAGREVFHHTFWPGKGMMPASSMIGGWVPMAAGYALTQKLENSNTITVCMAGDGSFGAGDLHEALNIVGVWKLPFVLVVENNGYQVSAAWNAMRNNRSLIPHVEPYGFVGRSVDGNDAMAMVVAMQWARKTALSGKPVVLDCETYRMGGYSSHLGEPRRAHQNEVGEWRKKDPIDNLAAMLAEAGICSPSEIDVLRQEVEDEVDAALEQVRDEMSGGRQ
jgi:pyruvate dehydrogenase E1 component alpha subunit